MCIRRRLLSGQRDWDILVTHPWVSLTVCLDCLLQFVRECRAFKDSADKRLHK